MEADFWLKKWEQNEIGFHQVDYNPMLVKHWNTVSASRKGKVFVPLCGKSKDMLFLVEQGHEVLGIELSEQAIKDFFLENSIEYNKKEYDGYDLYVSEKITLIRGDLFKVPRKLFKDIHLVFDRASMVALPTEMREDYVNLIKNNFSQSSILLMTFDFGNDEVGPPFSIPSRRVSSYYSSIFKIEEAERVQIDLSSGGMHDGKISKMENLTFILRGK